MAENFNFTEGSGAVGAADDISGVKYPFVKLVASAADSTDGLSKAEDSAHSSGEHGIMALTVRQDTAAALSGTDADYQPLITDANGRLHVLDANTANMLTALQIMDDWDDSDKCKVIIQTGANAIGKLAANTGVDIGDVDVTSIIPLTGATNLGKARDVACGANDVGVMALAVRDDTLTTLTPADGDYAPLRLSSTGQLHVTLGALPTSTNTIEVVGDVAEDAGVSGNPVLVGGRYDSSDRTLDNGDVGAIALAADGSVKIDDGGNTITIDGSITTVSTVTNLAQMGGTALSMDEGAVDAGCQRVTLATDDDGVAHLATIAGDTTNIETAIQIIDDWDATHAGAAVADGPQIMGAAYSTALPTDVGADADAARICTDRFGRVLAGIMPQNFQATMTSADAQSATPVKTKTASRKMYILSLVVSTDTAMNIQFQDDTGPTVLIEGMYFAANGGAHLTWPPEAPLVVNTNEDFDVIASTSGNISVTITGYLAV